MTYRADHSASVRRFKLGAIRKRGVDVLDGVSDARLDALYAAVVLRGETVLCTHDGCFAEVRLDADDEGEPMEEKTTEEMREELEAAGVEIPDDANDAWIKGAFKALEAKRKKSAESPDEEESAEDRADAELGRVAVAGIRPTTPDANLDKVRADNREYYAKSEERFAMRRSS